MIEILSKSGVALLSVVGVGIVLGAGLPAIYALGMRSLTWGITRSGSGDVVGRPRPQAIALASVFFAVVLAAIVYGILVIVFGKAVLPGGH